MDIIDKLNIMDSTKVNYRTKFKKMNDIGISWTVSEEEIIKKLESVEDKLNNILSYLNIAIVLRKYLKMPYELLKEYRFKLSEKSKNTVSDTNAKNIENKLPSKKDLIKYLNELLEDKEYKKFIINYLLITVSCRNQDLDLILTRAEPTDKENNYLYITDAEVKFIRNNYKTSKKYGQLINTFTDKIFIKVCNDFMGRNIRSKKLLANVILSSEIRDATYKKIGQSRYNKILLKETDKSQLLKLSKSRGICVMSHTELQKYLRPYLEI